MSTVALVLGGIRSGKSAYAEQLTTRIARGRSVYYLATGVAVDDDMAGRIRRHRQRRPAEWKTLETPLNPVASIQSALNQPEVQLDNSPPPTLLLDSLDGWVANLMFQHEQTPAAELEARTMGAARRFVAVTRELGADVVIVSSEVGYSLVATTPLGRHFQDMLGSTNQAVAAVADSVTLVVAGIPVTIKSTATP